VLTGQTGCCTKHDIDTEDFQAEQQLNCKGEGKGHPRTGHEGPDGE